MKEAKELLDPDELKNTKLVIVKEDERSFIWTNVLDAISAVPSLEVLS